MSREDHRRYDAALEKLRAEAELSRQKEPKSKWDVLAVVGVLLAVAGIAEMRLPLRVICFLAANACLVISLFGHTNWNSMWRWFGSVAVTICFLVAIYSVVEGNVSHVPSAAENAAAIVDALHHQDNQKTAVELGCEFRALPIRIPPGESLLLMLLNKKARNEGGFYEVRNSGNKEMSWPSKDLLELSRKRNKVYATDLYMYRCDVTNEGETKLLDVTINFTVNYASPKPITYPIIVNPLNAGKLFTFYMVNECPVLTSVIQPSSYSARILGANNMGTFPLLRPEKNSGERMMMFFPSSVSWTGEVC